MGWDNGFTGALAALERLRCAHGRLALALAALLVAAGAAALPGLLTGEDAKVLVPDRPARLAENFSLLSRSPLASRVFILLSADPGAPAGLLDRAADALEARLGPPLFTVPGPRPDGLGLVAGLLALAPSLVAPEDLQVWLSGLDRAAVRERLTAVQQALASPAALALKPLLRLDPLDARSLPMGLLPRPGAGKADPDPRGRLRSPDGASLVLAAATDIPFTDAAGAERLLAGFELIRIESLPAGVDAVLVSGHRHSLANARTIKADLGRVLPLSLLGLAAVVFGFMRDRGAVWVLLAPPAVLCLAGAATGLLFGGLHGIVLGFGGVLMGLAVDYPVHVHHALRRSPGPAEALARVARPVVFGALTSLAAFSALLLSEIPAIRQMAVFSMLGLAAALALSWLALPQIVPSAGGADPAPTARLPVPAAARARGAVLAVWAAGVLCLAWLSLGLTVNPDLASLGMSDPVVKADEARLREALGGLRERAMVFASGPDLDQAAAANAAVLAELRRAGLDQEALSLAPLLPPPAAQERNRAAWREAWAGPGGQTVLRDLRDTAREQGFADQAFAPFLDLASGWAEGNAKPADLAALRSLGLGQVTGLLAHESADGVSLLTLLPDGPDLAADLGRALEALPGVRVVSGAGFARELGAALRSDCLLFVGLSVALVCGLVLALFRRPGPAAAALAPAATGLAAVAAGARLAQGGLGLFNVVALPLVLGLAADYGIFMVCRTRGLEASAGRPVLVCGLTTLAGFGSLAVAQHPALRSLGLSILLGIGAALPTALLVTPRLLGQGEARHG